MNNKKNSKKPSKSDSFKRQVDAMVILPCPFCKSRNITVDVVYPNDNGGGYGITCHRIGCMGNIFRHNDFYPTKESVIRAWNKRAI